MNPVTSMNYIYSTPDASESAEESHQQPPKNNKNTTNGSNNSLIEAITPMKNSPSMHAKNNSYRAQTKRALFILNLSVSFTDEQILPYSVGSVYSKAHVIIILLLFYLYTYKYASTQCIVHTHI